MYFDVFTIAALVDEFQEQIVGGRVQKVFDLNETAIGLEIYANRQRHYLVLDADPPRPHVNLVEGKLRRGLPKPTQLGLLMRRYVEGGIISQVSQPPWERVISLRFDHPGGVSDIIVEAIERRANILLVQEGLILDCIRRVGIQDNRVRVSLPGRDYVPPPPQESKVTPDAVLPGDIEVALDSDPGTNAWRTLTRAIVGISPVLAREIVFQATGKANAKAGDTSARAVYDTFAEAVEPLLNRKWNPGTTTGEDGRASAFAVFPISYLSGWDPAPTVSDALAEFYGAPVGEDAYRRAKEPVGEQLRQAIIRVSHKVNSLRQGLKSEQELDSIRQAGELLLAYQYTIEKGASEFSAQYDMEGPPQVIKLDPALSALDNAKRYFARYEKAKRAQADVPQRLEAAERELGFLRQLETDLALATNWPDIDEVRDALERDGYWRGPRQVRPQAGKSAPLKVATPEGFVIWVGRNSRQNDLVTFGKGGASDAWLHVRGIPGAHVIIKSDGRPIPELVVERAAELAAYFSAARNEGRTLVDMTLRKYVKKIHGGKPGMVTYRNEETREVQPRGLGEE
jgi:predicted ribosome quality control (RQC) complex YloA/Tae2 family protein